MMKRWFLWLVMAAALAASLSACAGQPQIVVTENNLELGNVVNGEVVTREVRLQNMGQADLVIEGVSTSCGCTQATVEPMIIPPGGRGTISIRFDSGAHGPELTGPLIRQIFIASNDPQQPELVVELEANILPPSG
jgi:hypothetical protein